MRTSKFSVSKQLPITSVVSPSPQLAVIEQLEHRSALLSAAESCRILDMHPKTLYERLRSGELKGIKDHGKWKIDPRNLAEYIRRSELTRKNTDHRDRKSTAVPKKPAATVHEKVSCPQLSRSEAEELHKFGFTMESLTLTIPRVIVNCIVRHVVKAETLQPFQNERKVESDSEEFSRLTIQERRVYQLLQHGKQNKEISSEMGIATSTAAFHVRNILRKFGFSSRIQVLLQKSVL